MLQLLQGSFIYHNLGVNSILLIRGQPTLLRSAQNQQIFQLSDNMGVIAKYTYDGNGNQLTVTDGLDRTMTYAYDALNRRVSETLPSGATTRYQYDVNSNLLSVTDAKGNSTFYTYSALNQRLTYTDALNAITKFEYDANGNLSKATDANGNATAYAYDALNQNTAITFANGLSLQYTYDELGNVVASKDRAGRESKYIYNPLGDLLTKTYPDGTTDKYTYDGISRMLSAINKNATVTFTYDKAGRLLSETLSPSGGVGGGSTYYSYDVAAGKRTLTYPSGMKVVEQLNARDLITSILQNGEEVVTMAYNAVGQKTQQVYANGITTDYSYNENGWLSEIKADHDIMHLQMEYDAIGNMTKRIDALNAERTESYGYDVISQLTSFKRGTTVDKSYQFDLLGNRIKTLENGVVTNYTSNNVNAYTNITGGLNFTPQYDDNGNMLNDDKHTYQYDYNNKLVSVDETIGTYKYDALGRRIAKNNTLFYYVGDQMVEEVTGNVTTSYLYGNDIDEALQMKRVNDTYYYHTNHLGSTMALTQVDGTLQERVEYDAYGLPSFFDANSNVVTGSSVDNTILFTGREFNVESNRYYFRARSLHPEIGRFMQKDPLMYVDGMNDYAYVNENPINLIDLAGTNSNNINKLNKLEAITAAITNYPNSNSKLISKPIPQVNSSTTKFLNMTARPPKVNSSTTKFLSMTARGGVKTGAKYALKRNPVASIATGVIITAGVLVGGTAAYAAPENHYDDGTTINSWVDIHSGLWKDALEDEFELELELWGQLKNMKIPDRGLPTRGVGYMPPPYNYPNPQSNPNSYSNQNPNNNKCYE